MKFLFIVAFLSLSASAFAISNEKLVAACKSKAVQKLEDISSARGCVIETNHVIVDGIDNRLLNPSKYIWFSVEANCEKKVEIIKTMVQYDSFSRVCI